MTNTARREHLKQTLEQAMRANMQAQAPVEYAQEEREFLEALDALSAAVGTDEHYAAYERAKLKANWKSEYEEIARLKPDAKELFRMQLNEEGEQSLYQMSAELVTPLNRQTETVVYSADFYDPENRIYPFRDVTVIFTPRMDFELLTAEPDRGPIQVVAIFKGGRVDIETWHDPNDNGDGEGEDFGLYLVLDELVTEYLFLGGLKDNEL